MFDKHLVIGIDASRAVKDNPTGTEYYSWEIINALLKLDRKNRYRLYAPKMPEKSFGEAQNVEWRIIPTGRLWSQLKLARELRQRPPDVLFVPAHVVPLLSNVPSVVTIHGLEFLHSPESYGRRELAYLKFAITSSVSKAKRIITPSVSTRNDVIKAYRCPGGKITVIPEAFNQERFRLKKFDETPPVEGDYIFFLGRLETRKNLSLLIDAFNLLRKENLKVTLVLAGKPGHGFDNIRTKIKSLPPAVQEKIILPGYLPDDEAALFLRHATAFVYPSLYEGFGLPILEAFASGVPVVASNTSSLPEVAGDAAVLLPPINPLSWAAALSRIIHQKSYAATLRERGFKQASQFSWAKAAQATLRVIEDVAA